MLSMDVMELPVGTCQRSLGNQDVSRSLEGALNQARGTPNHAAFVDALFNEVDDSDFPVVEIEDEDGGLDDSVVLTEDLIAEEVKLQAEPDSDYEEPIELSSAFLNWIAWERPTTRMILKSRKSRASTLL